MLNLFHRVQLRRWLGILTCALALGPAIVVYAAVLKGVHAESIQAFVDYLLGPTPAKLVRGCGIIAASSVPVLLVYAYVMRKMRRVTGDSILSAMLYGCVIPPATIAIVAAVLKLEMDSREVIEVLVSSIIGLAIGAFYWLLVIRFDRRAVHARDENARAISAMD